MSELDLVVVGGGTAGLVTALGAAAVGASVALVERERPGGDCLWTGCVPSKALIAAADAAHAVTAARALGLEAAAPSIDGRAVLGHVRRAIATIEPHDSRERLEAEGVRVLAGHARFLDARTVAVDGPDGHAPLRFRHAVVATGSAPAMPPIAGLEEARPLTTDTLWSLETLPASSLVVGAGPIGCELGQALARLGGRVVLLESGARILPRAPAPAAEVVRAQLAADGVDVRCGVAIARVERRAGRVHVRLADGAVVEADELLVAAGRTPRTAGLDLAAAGVALDARGHVRVDARLRTSARRIYAAGDVTGGPAFTHVAAYHGGLVVQNALLGLRRRACHGAVPAVVYTDPELAHVGIAHAAAGPGARLLRVDHAGVDRAIVEGDTRGFTELVADRRGRLVGATVVGAGAGDAIAELAMAVRLGLRVRALAGAVHAYPTRGEAAQRAALLAVRADLDRHRGTIRLALAVRRRLP